MVIQPIQIFGLTARSQGRPHASDASISIPGSQHRAGRCSGVARAQGREGLEPNGFFGNTKCRDAKNINNILKNYTCVNLSIWWQFLSLSDLVYPLFCAMVTFKLWKWKSHNGDRIWRDQQETSAPQTQLHLQETSISTLARCNRRHLWSNCCAFWRTWLVSYDQI